MSGPDSWTGRLGGIASLAVPFVLALSHLGSSAAWHGDLALLRGISWAGISAQGTVSALAIGLASYLPLGSVTFRAALPAALALGGVGLCTYRLTRRLLDAHASAARLAVPLSVIAAMAATSSVTGQSQGTIPGGGALPVSMALALLLTEPEKDEPCAVASGALWGALAIESLLLAILVFLAAATRRLVERRRWSVATWARFGAGGVAAVLFLLLPLALAPFAPSFLELGRSISDLGPDPFWLPRPGGGLAAFTAEMGPVALGLSTVGCIVGAASAGVRGRLASMVAVVAGDRLLSWREGKSWAPEIAAPAHLLALVSLAAASALAVHAVATYLRDARLPMARGAAIFLVMFDLALVVAAAEDASFAQVGAATRGAEAFTDEALERLPTGAAILLRSRPLAMRLWGARSAEGARPDVVLIPLRILGEGRIALGLLREEPEVQALLRDVSIEGRPLEHSLTALADARPLEVELDPSWDRRITSHLTSEHLWLRFAPEPLGPSDRKAALATLRPRLEMVLQASRVEDRIDEATRGVLQARLKDYGAVAALLGDRDELPWLTEAAHKVESGAN